MKNPYRIHLNSYFETIIDFKHTANRLNSVLLKDVEIFTDEKAIFFSGSALVISDWSGSTDKGWEKNFHTGILKSTMKEQYASEINSVLSREFGMMFAQCFEALERFLKNIAREKGKVDQVFRNLMLHADYSSQGRLKGGVAIFNLIKIAGGFRFKEYSQKNNHNFKFKEVFTVFAEIRHVITHSQANLRVDKIPATHYYKNLFEHMLPLNNLTGDKITLLFDYKTIDRLLIYLAEFGYQIFKILSEEENYEWEI